MSIKYHKVEVACRPTYRTIKYGNLLSDTIQGEVYQNNKGDWSGWFTNHSDSSKTEFKLGFGSRAAASRWVNKQLRMWKVKG